MSNKNVFESVAPMKGATENKKSEDKAAAPEKEIKVKALYSGYIHPRRIEEGDEFFIAESKFSKRWMEKIEEKK